MDVAIEVDADVNIDMDTNMDMDMTRKRHGREHGLDIYICTKK